MEGANESQEILTRNMTKGVTGGVPIRKMRFPGIDGVEQKVTLIANRGGMYHNIGFAKGIENTVMGHVADILLDAYPGTFSVLKVNGKRVMEGKKLSDREEIVQEVMRKIQEDFDLVPKKDTSRLRKGEPQAQQVSAPPVGPQQPMPGLGSPATGSDL